MSIPLAASIKATSLPMPVAPPVISAAFLFSIATLRFPFL
jgi:hypothetical protein